MKSTYLELLFSLLCLVARCQCQNINGHLRVASCHIQNSSVHLSSPSANKLSLIEAKLIGMLAVYLNFTYEIHTPTDVLQLGSPLKMNDEGSWTGVLGQIVRHEVDLTTSFGPQLYSRSRNVDITVPVIVDNIVIIVPYPQQHSDILDMFDMFSPLFWTSFIAVNFIVGYAIYCVAFLKRAEDKHVLAYQNVLMKGVGITLGQGGDFRHHSLPCRMIVGSWLFAILVFNNAFTGSLISMITNQKFQYVIQSIEDVATDEDVCTTAHHQRIQYTFRIQGIHRTHFSKNL
ncbi:glutamate receptor ionotropic, delta-2 [Daphnia magna]|uniref:glutamate receptor ionotropic, delta-2 n=1 Tax=Daphnia magna TaxID=35525 RepID=UPI001E1BB3EA|nr:glutamate receptor ionotropic, delta-2 [Daphnia magna]